MPSHGDLTGWATQGVLLLNAALTVQEGSPGSRRKGWEKFTDAIIRRDAREKGALIDRKKHKVLEASHPSPLSARHSFFRCGHFKEANSYLKKHGLDPVGWEKI